MSDCVLWSGRLNSSGYGPHRRIWIEANGPVAPDHEVNHRCGVRNCVNLGHLEVLPRAAHRQKDVDRRLGVPEHGSRRMYENGCRCDACRTHNAERALTNRRRLGIEPPPVAQHGTRTMYVKRCRCEPCKESSRRYEQARRLRSAWDWHKEDNALD